jgi:hypothetical protein
MIVPGYIPFTELLPFTLASTSSYGNFKKQNTALYVASFIIYSIVRMPSSVGRLEIYTYCSTLLFGRNTTIFFGSNDGKLYLLHRLPSVWARKNSIVFFYSNSVKKLWERYNHSTFHRRFHQREVLVPSSVGSPETIILYLPPYIWRKFHYLLLWHLCKKIIITPLSVAYNIAFFCDTFIKYCYPTIRVLYYSRDTFIKKNYSTIHRIFLIGEIWMPSLVATP